MDPVRVKVYGLFPLTRRRYLAQAIGGLLLAVVVFVGWFFSWPGMRPRLVRADLPPSTARSLTVAIMDNVPWILLAAVAYEATEAYIVLRIFARKEAGQAVGPGKKSAPP